MRTDLSDEDVEIGVVRLSRILAAVGGQPTCLSVHPETWPWFRQVLHEYCQLHGADTNLPPEVAVFEFMSLVVQVDERVPIGNIRCDDGHTEGLWR